ncbi:metal-dependent hydrolase [Halorarum salinum]|uniref:Metal-dependent hydrolase n=2 Tax=Halorarum salinum TaxID=2743089 RepID=A0A7D5L9L6_9EURY|nr:metal-dependent hydrolase [Halobaculum salinum]QLG61210.1 metal-dependent hydrolase [Halobaculum salinum]
MATTHALAGVLIGLATAALFPVSGAPVVLAGALGGAFPDLDVLAVHRRTLHFPVGYAALGTVAAGLAVLTAGGPYGAATWFLTAAAFLAAAAVHAGMDVFGGGLELRPWEATSNRGVYDHFNGRWRAPKRWVRYDGAPEDFALALALGLPTAVALQGTARVGVLALLVISGTYALVRKPLVDGGERLVRWLPAWALRLVPETLIEDLR